MLRSRERMPVQPGLCRTASDAQLAQAPACAAQCEADVCSVAPSAACRVLRVASLSRFSTSCWAAAANLALRSAAMLTSASPATCTCKMMTFPSCRVSEASPTCPSLYGWGPFRHTDDNRDRNQSITGGGA